MPIPPGEGPRLMLWILNKVNAVEYPKLNEASMVYVLLNKVINWLVKDMSS